MTVFSALRRVALSLTPLLALLAFPSCEDRPATAVTLAIASEVSIPKEVDAISLEVRRGGKVSFSRSYAVDPETGQAKIPGSLVLKLHPDEEAKDAVRVLLRAEQKGEQILLRSAATSFAEGKNKLLRLVIRYSCLDFPQVCGEGETCLGGVCSKDAVDPATLPDAPPEEQIFPTRSQGGCFDGGDDKCAASRTTLQDLDAFTQADCSFDAATAEGYKPGQLNVFAFWSAQGNQGHPVVLDQDPQEGWSFLPEKPTVARLAKGLCDQIRSGRIFRVAYNFACPTKALSVPSCRPDTPEPEKTFEASDCHTCAYAPPECKEALALARAEAASKPLFDAAFACPYDGAYSTLDECEGVRSCFLGALAPMLSCSAQGCDPYPAAKAWEDCVASLEEPSKRCPACTTEGLPLCLKNP
jgi:hypothetical protein